MIEVGGVGDDERESFVRAFATAFSNVVEQPFIADVLTLFDHDVYRPIAARDDGRIVGTALEMPLELTVRPGVTVPCRGITWVGVLPTHRRRGVMRALLGDHLAECERQGVAASLLHASNSGIYLSHGYGAATRRARVCVAVPHITFREPAPDLELRMIDPLEAHDACQAVWERCRPVTPGFTSRPDPELQWTLKDLKGFCAFAGDDGYVLYGVEREWPGANAEYRREGARAAGRHAGRLRGALALPVLPHARGRDRGRRAAAGRAPAAPRHGAAAGRRVQRRRRRLAATGRPRGAVRGARAARPGRHGRGVREPAAGRVQPGLADPGRPARAGAGRRLDIARRALVAARVLTRASAAGTARGGEPAPTLARPVRRVGAAPKAAKSAAGYPDRGRGSSRVFPIFKS